MIKNSKHIIVVILILLFVGVSCIKNDLEEIDENLVFNPEYSLPIGKKEVILEELVPPGLNAYEISDTIGVPTTSIFNYEGKNYTPPRMTFSKTSFMAFDFSKLSDKLEDIESLMFRVNAVNEIPAQCELMVFFTNETGTETNLLFTDGWYTIAAAEQRNDGIVIPVEQYKKDIYYDKNNIESLYDKKTIIINTRLLVENPTDEIIEYLSTQTLKVQLALRFSFESTSNEI